MINLMTMYDVKGCSSTKKTYRFFGSGFFSDSADGCFHAKAQINSQFATTTAQNHPTQLEPG